MTRAVGGYFARRVALGAALLVLATLTACGASARGSLPAGNATQAGSGSEIEGSGGDAPSENSGSTQAMPTGSTSAPGATGAR